MEKKVIIPYFIKGKNKFIGVIQDNNPDYYMSRDEYLICTIPKKEESKSEFFKVIGDNECYLLKIKKKSVQLDNGIFVCKKDNRILFLNLEKQMPDVSELSFFTIYLQLYFRDNSIRVKFFNFFKNLFVVQKLQKS